MVQDRPIIRVEDWQESHVALAYQTAPIAVTLKVITFVAEPSVPSM